MSANQDKPVIQLTKDELKDLMEQAVHDAFVRMGVEANNPLEMQRDFQHLREWRVATTALRAKGLLVTLTIIMSGTIGALWLGFRDLITGG